ncbi:MAG: nucleotidyltransferase family protein [Rubrobacter sp.]|nr:nucleotidyltransferase family protein [Rubrobacter sp.]
MTRSRGPKTAARPEIELLLLYARTHIDPETAIRIEALLQKYIDWDYLIETAREHGMMPLLYWNLNATCPEAVPNGTLDQLRDRFQKNARRNVFMTGELLRLLNLFETHGISAVPFKGPSMAVSIYGNIALRQFTDLDILLREQDVLEAKDLLLSMGYQPEYRLTHQRETVLLQASHEYSFVHENKVKVELHWKITSEYFSFSLDFEHLWKRLKRSSLAGKEVPTLSPEDLLLILCVHSASHVWQQLEFVCGVAELIRANEKLDWGQVIEQARELGSERMLFLGLFLASDLLGAPLPDEVLQRVRADPSVKALATQARERLFREPGSLPGILESSLFHLRARERMQDKVRYCVQLAMVPNHFDWGLSLPASLSFVYYILRQIRLASKFGRGLLRWFL